MWHSIETRLPFVDYQMLEKSLNLDVSVKIRDGWTKYVLRKMMHGLLPEGVLWRRDKLGFNAPEQTWLSVHSSHMKLEIENSGLLRSMCDMDKLMSRYDKLDLKMKWRLVNLAVWARIYNVSVE